MFKVDRIRIRGILLKGNGEQQKWGAKNRAGNANAGQEAKTVSSVIIVMELDILQGTVLSQSIHRILIISRTSLMLMQPIENGAVLVERGNYFFLAGEQLCNTFDEILKYQNLKERFGNKNPVTSSDAPSFDSMFVIGKLNEQIQSRGNMIHELKEKISRLTKKNSDTDPTFNLKALVSQNKDLTAKLNALHDLNDCFRSLHLHYIKRLKENVETLHEIVEDAKVERPLDTSLASACRYTKHSQELLEYVIGTCPKDFGPRDTQNAFTNSLRKKQVTFVESCETSTHNTLSHVEHQKIHSTNASGIPFTGVNGASAASRNTPPKVLPTKQWKPTGRLLPLGRQCPLVRSTALKSDCLPADPQETICPCRSCTDRSMAIYDSGSQKHMTGDRSRSGIRVKMFIGMFDSK
ncbi:hypothetical protein Tco_0659362 [Tanacetum coccineum]